MYLQGLRDKPSAVHAALVAVTLLPLYYGSYVYRSAHPYGGAEPSVPAFARPLSEDFVGDWLDTHLVEPFNPSAIYQYCNTSTWHPNLIFRLDNANGGIGNVRGNMLDFLFQAIEAGASIVVPDMAARSQEDISNVWASRATFDAFFDVVWFLQAMKEACPQMKIYNVKKGGKLPAEPLTAGNYLPRSRRIDQEVEMTRKEALANLEKWMEETGNFNPSTPTLVNSERTLWDIDTRSLPHSLRRNLGQLLRTNPAIREYAAIIVENLAKKFSLDIHPRVAIPKAAFHCAHLRTEADAQNAGWTDAPHGNWSAQTDAYIAHALKHKLRLSYVASGNVTDLERFKRKALAQKPPITVTSKFELLPARDAAALKQLSWDQQALVDYEVLQRCSVFAGFVKSSFAFNIAMTRGQWVEDEGRVVDPWYVKNREADVTFDDGISRILGRDDWHEQRIPRGMWP